MMRTAAILVFAVAAACSGGGKSGGGGGNTGGRGRRGLARATDRCTPPDGIDGAAAAAECTARPDAGCKYTQQLTCSGVEPPPDVQEAERQARESGSIACACVCDADVVACSQVP